jgi:hypothetical protein
MVVTSASDPSVPYPKTISNFDHLKVFDWDRENKKWKEVMSDMSVTNPSGFDSCSVFCGENFFVAAYGDDNSTLRPNSIQVFQRQGDVWTSKRQERLTTKPDGRITQVSGGKNYFTITYVDNVGSSAYAPNQVRAYNWNGVTWDCTFSKKFEGDSGVNVVCGSDFFMVDNKLDMVGDYHDVYIYKWNGYKWHESFKKQLVTTPPNYNISNRVYLGAGNDFAVIG